MTHPLVGKNLGRYRIQQELGHGGMGTVLKAYDPSLNREVAIKVLAAADALGDESVQRFLNEARSNAQLEHPNIVRVYEIGQADGYFFIVMQLIAGESLAATIRTRGALPLPEVKRVVSQLAKALDYAHSRGVVHRDLKPGNIIVEPSGQVWLVDFGLAKALESAELTRAGEIPGTPAYMSPEQVKSEPITPATDLYNLGLVTYEMLTGRVAFQGDSSHAVLFKQVYENPPPLRQVNPTLPQAAETVVMKALEKEPKDRWATAGAFANAVLGVPAGPAKAPGPAVVVPASSSPTSPLLPLGAGLLIALLLLVLVVAMAQLMGGGSGTTGSGQGNFIQDLVSGNLLQGFIGGAEATAAASMEATAETAIAIDASSTQTAEAIATAEAESMVATAAAVAAAATQIVAQAEAPATALAAAPPDTAGELEDTSRPSAEPHGDEPIAESRPSAEPHTGEAVVVAAAAQTVGDRCAGGLAVPALLGPPSGTSCREGGCTCAWQWADALQPDEYFQVQFQPAGTTEIRGLNGPTKDSQFVLGSNVRTSVFADVCKGGTCPGKWSVAVVKWDGANPGQIGCVIARSEWHEMEL